jgi:hypothetical protein
MPSRANTVRRRPFRRHRRDGGVELAGRPVTWGTEEAHELHGGRKQLKAKRTSPPSESSYR